MNMSSNVFFFFLSLQTVINKEDIFIFKDNFLPTLSRIYIHVIHLYQWGGSYIQKRQMTDIHELNKTRPHYEDQT